jgi:hypothetical protein
LLSVQNIGHLRRLLETLKELRFDHGVRDDDLETLLGTFESHWEEACRKGRTKVKCLIAQREYASAALLQACITRDRERSFYGKVPDLADLENSAEIASARGDISETLDLQWIILEHLIDTDSNDEPKGQFSQIEDAYDRIVKLTKISLHQVQRVAEMHGLHVDMCLLLNHPLYKVLRLASYSSGEMLLDWIIEDEQIDSRYLKEARHPIWAHPIWVAVRQEDDVSIKFLLKNHIGVLPLQSWQPSFGITGPNFPNAGNLSDLSFRARVESLPIIHGSILHYAVAFQPEAFVSALLDSGVNLSQEDDMGETPLHVAVLVGRPSMMNYYYQEGPMPTQ